MSGHAAGEVALAVGGRLVGDPGAALSDVRPLDQAGPAHLSFLSHPAYRELARRSAAGCVLVADENELPGRPVIVAKDPHRAYALAMRLFHPEVPRPAGVHPSASVHAGARLAAGVHVGAGAVVGDGATVGEGTAILAGAVVSEGCAVGAGCALHPGVVLYPGTRLGDRVVVHANAVLGSDGFGYASNGEGHLKIPHAGRVVVEDDVEIGAGSCIDRAVMGETRIGRGTKIDNLVQVAHNVTLGPHCLLVAQSGIAGSTSLGAFVVLAGQAGAAGHLRLGDGARVAAKSAALQDVPAGATVAGIPAVALGAWKRVAAALPRLPELARRVRRLEAAGGLEAERPREGSEETERD